MGVGVVLFVLFLQHRLLQIISNMNIANSIVLMKLTPRNKAKIPPKDTKKLNIIILLYKVILHIAYQQDLQNQTKCLCYT